MRKRPEPIDRKRIRKITGSFGWIDHRFVRDGFLRDLHPTEAMLYFFLAAVSNHQGVSFYGLDMICYLLHIPYEHTIKGAIAELIERGLIAYDDGIFQVLPLPEKPLKGGQ